MNNNLNKPEQTFESEKPQFNFVRFLVLLFGLSFDAPPIEIYSTKQPQEVISQLKENLDSSWGNLILTFKPKFIGKTKENKFAFWWFQPGRRNSWAPIVRGVVEPAPSGSVIKAHFDVHNAVKIFSIFWMGSLLAISVFMFFMPTGHGISLFPLGMILFMLLLVKIGNVMGKPDCKKIIELLERVSKP